MLKNQAVAQNHWPGSCLQKEGWGMGTCAGLWDLVVHVLQPRPGHKPLCQQRVGQWPRGFKQPKRTVRDLAGSWARDNPI